MNLTEGEKERFWAKVRKTDQCWEWIGAKARTGYGFFGVKRKMKYAHRVSYAIAKDKDPGRLFCCHKCDNTSCVNPDHLFLGTHQDNMRDMKTKGRSNPRRGVASNFCKMTEDTVREIRSADGAVPEIAKRFGVSRQAVSRIRSREAWSHII